MHPCSENCTIQFLYKIPKKIDFIYFLRIKNEMNAKRYATNTNTTIKRTVTAQSHKMIKIEM